VPSLPQVTVLMEVAMIKEQRSHTTLPAADLGRAKKFYAEKLGLRPSTESPGGLFYVTGGGTRFILYPTPNPTRGGHTQMGFAVQDIERTVSDLQAAGVAFEEYDFPGLKTDRGIAQTGDVRAAWFKDSEGNIGIVQLPAGVDPA
jgi:catechol 2,3-dioxygenase-like lactoylglutathione lyase family enzyme